MKMITKIVLHLAILLLFSGYGSCNGEHIRLPTISNSSTCKEMLDSFAFMTSNFTSCAIRHARPISLCQACVSSYFQVNYIYSSILEIENMGGGLCKDQLINLDRLQVVSSGINYVNQLWSRAFCDSCYVLDHSGKPTLSDNVVLLLNISAQLEQCVSQNRNESLYPDLVTCTKCLDSYTILNIIYERMKADSGEINFCMDVIDMINSTRFFWSRTLGCYGNQKKPEKTFIGIMSAIMMVSFLFYIMVFMFTRKEEHPVAPQSRWREQYKRSSISSNIIT